MAAPPPDQLGEAMLALADRLFDDFDDLPVIAVIQAMNASRADLASEPLEVHAVEARTRERLRHLRCGGREREWHLGAWLGTVAVAATTFGAGPALDLVATYSA